MSDDRRPWPTVEVVPYDPSWPARFQAELLLLEGAAPGLFQSIEHVGSTSVPGLVAKPTLDILAVAADARLVLGHLPALADAGYDHRPGSFPELVDHEFLRKVVGRVRTHHLHVLSAGSPEIEGYRLFRDYLIAEPSVAARYGAVKTDLAARYAHDRPAYVSAKSAWVEVLLHEARRWRAGASGGGS